MAVATCSIVTPQMQKILKGVPIKGEYHHRQVTQWECEKGDERCYRKITGTVVGYSWYELKSVLHVCPEPIPFEDSCGDWGFSPPVLYWKELTIFVTRTAESLPPDIKFEYIGKTLRIFPGNYIIVTDVFPHNCGFRLGFMRKPSDDDKLLTLGWNALFHFSN